MVLQKLGATGKDSTVDRRHADPRADVDTEVLTIRVDDKPLSLMQKWSPPSKLSLMCVGSCQARPYQSKRRPLLRSISAQHWDPASQSQRPPRMHRCLSDHSVALKQVDVSRVRGDSAETVGERALAALGSFKAVLRQGHARPEVNAPGSSSRVWTFF